VRAHRDVPWRLFKSYNACPKSGRVQLTTPDGMVARFLVTHLRLRPDEPWEIAASVPKGSEARRAIQRVDAWLGDIKKEFGAGVAAAAMPMCLARFAEFILGDVLVRARSCQSLFSTSGLLGLFLSSLHTVLPWWGVYWVVVAWWVRGRR
jgi:hypothetical protein